MATLLRTFAAIIVVVGLMHIVFGLHADAMLGANPSIEAVENPSLDSQNRFYGAAFMLYGVVIWLFTTDMKRHAPVFRAALIIFFIGGLARIVSAAMLGLPAPAIQFLAAIELIIPPALLWWDLRRQSGFRSTDL
jgi:Domain of unknown function (DUF4345)